MTATRTKIGGPSKPPGPPRRPFVSRRRVEPNLKTYSGRVAARVRALRDKRGWAAEDLAKKIGVPVKTLYSYESGDRVISPDLYPNLAEAFGMSVRAFLPAE